MMSSLKSVFPCKKPRRSPRLETKERTDTQSQAINDGSLGYFEIIPLELKFLVFTYLRIEDLSILTISSKAMRNVIELYKNTRGAPQFTECRSVTHQTVPLECQQHFQQEFRRLGLLMKRSTCLYTTKDRLRLMQQFLQKGFLCSLNKCLEPTKCIALMCFGKFLHTVIAGWDDKECARTFEYIGESTNMLKNLNTVVKSRAGSLGFQELNVRLFFRRVFIDQCRSKTDKAFWLSLILRSYPMVQQARILFILFGPIFGVEIQWFDMCESTPVNKDHARICFGDLASSFRLLHYYSKEWTEDATISVIDEITCYPEQWLAENTANLLYLCGDSITMKVLSSKAINGRLQELANIITSLCLVCWRHAQPVTWAIEIVHGLCSVFEHPRERICFLHTIIDTFKEVILDLHEFGDAVDEESGLDFQNMLDAQTDFSRELIILAFQGSIKT